MLTSAREQRISLQTMVEKNMPKVITTIPQ